MHNKILLAGAASVLVLLSGQSLASPFNSMDPRSFAMGGAGVAAGNPGNAGFMNPALLATAHEDDDFSLELPIVGARIFDQGDVIDAIDDYKGNNLEQNFDSALNDYKASGSGADADRVASTGTALRNQLSAMSNQSLQAEVMAGLIVGIPSKKVGASLNVSTRFMAGGLMDITANDLGELQRIINAASLNPPTLSLGEVFSSNSLTSSLFARGAALTEVGISLAREIELGGSKFGLGLTPKVVKVTTFDYRVDVQTADFDSESGEKDYSDFNFDIGLAKDYGNGWKIGFVVQDMLSQEYETVLGNKFKIEPKARVGVAHATDWTTVTVDVDLQENDPVAYDVKTQYLAMGAELDIFDSAQLRLGYKHNMSDDATSAPTVGLGLSPWGVHIDIAASANDDEVGVSLQLGFRI